MRRWNGWGDDSVETSMSRSTRCRSCGTWSGRPAHPLTRRSTRWSLRSRRPASVRAATDAGLDLDPLERVRHARGQSLPDWIALRTGRLGPCRMRVARPADSAAVAALLAAAVEPRLRRSCRTAAAAASSAA